MANFGDFRIVSDSGRKSNTSTNKTTTKTTASTQDKDKQRKFYRAYKSGLLDEKKITNEGWKNLYEYELEKGYSSASDIPRDTISKYGIDTSIGRSNSISNEPIDTSLNTPTIEPTIETKEKESLFNRLSSFFGNLGNDNVPKYKQDFDVSTMPKTSTNLGDLLPKQNPVGTNFNSAVWNSVIDQKNQGLGLKPNFNNKSLVEQDDPLLMALNSKIDPKFIGEHTKQVMNTINTNRFNKQMQEQSQLDQFGARNPYLPDGSINPNGSIAIPQDRPRVDSANQPFLSDGTLNPAGSILESGAGYNNLKAGLHGAYREFIGRNAQLNTDKIIGQTSSALDRGVNQDMAQKVANQRTEDREYWTEDRMFNAFLGKPHDAEITSGESVSRGIGGFAGNLGKMLLFSQVLGPATTKPQMLAKNAKLGFASRTESAYSRGEDPETIVKEGLIGAGSFAIGELAGIGVTNKLTNQLIHTFKTQPQWANHLTALVRSARGITDGTVGTLSEIALSNAMGKETEIGLKDAIQSGLIMGIVNGVTSYIPWGRFNISEKEMKDFNIKVDEVDGDFLKSNGYIKLSEVEGVNPNNPYMNDLYINPTTKDIVVSATRDGAFLVPTSMVQDTLDSQTLDMINRIEDTPIRQGVDHKAQPDYIDKVSNPKQYENVLESYMKNEGYSLQTLNGEQVFAKYNKVSNIEGDWEIMPRAKAEQKFENEYFTRYKNTQGPKIKTGPRTEQATIGRFDDSYEVNRAAMDTTGKQWVKDMQDKGYSEYKPGVWVKEVDGNIVDIVPEFTVGKGGKAIPVFDITDGDTKTSRIGVKGFVGGEYDIDGSSTKQANPYVEQAQKDAQALIKKALSDPDLKGNKQYDKFVENVVNMEYNLKMLDEAGESNKGLNDFLNKESTKNSLKLFKDFVDGKDFNKEELFKEMRKFNNDFQRLNGMADVASPTIKSASTRTNKAAEDNIDAEAEKTNVVSNDTINDLVDENLNNAPTQFEEGQVVEFTSPDGETLKGTIRYIDEDEEEATIKVEGSTLTAGGVPIGRVEYVKLKDIKNLDSDTPLKSSTSDLNKEVEQMVEGDAETLVEGQQATTNAGKVQVGSAIEYQSGDKVNSGIIVRIEGDRIFIKNKIDDFVTKDIHKNSIISIKSETKVPESSTIDFEQIADEVAEDEIKTSTTATEEAETTSKELEGYSEAERYAIGEFAQKLTADRQKGLDGKMTDEEITEQFNISVDVAKQLVGAINSKDFELLTSRLNRQNKNSLKLFTDLTGLSTKTQKETLENIRSLDPEAYDKWKQGKEDEVNKQKEIAKQQELEAKEKEKQEALEEIGQSKVRTTNGLTTLSEHVVSSFDEGYRLIKTNDYGGYEWVNSAADKSLNYKGLSKEQKRYVREKYKEFEEKAIADDEAKEQAEYDAMSDEEKEKYEADMAHLFGKDKATKVEAGGEEESEDVVEDELKNAKTVYELGGFKAGDRVIEKKNSKNKGTIIKFYNNTAQVKLDDGGADTYYSLGLIEKFNEKDLATKELQGKMLKEAAKVDSIFSHVEGIDLEELTPEYILDQAKWISDQYQSDGNSYYDELHDDDKDVRKWAVSDKRKVENFIKKHETLVKELESTGVDEVVNPEPIEEETINSPTVQKDEYNIVRVGNQGANLKPSTIPQGLYVSIPDNADDFKSPHDVGNIKYIGTAKPKNTLVVTDTKVEHARFGASKEGYGSAGVVALKTLVGDDEFNRLLKLNKREMTELLNEKYPGNDYGRYYDSYELLEAYAGLLARDKGYDSILLEVKEFHELSELVILKDNIMEITQTKLIDETVASNEPQEQSESSTRPTGQDDTKKPTDKPIEVTDVTEETSPVKNAEKEVVEQNEGINKTKINTQDYFLKDVIENIREDLSNVIDADTVDEIIDNFEGSGLGYISNLDANDIQQDFILGGLKNLLNDDKLANKVYNMILGEVKRLNGGVSDDNRTNDAKTDNREQLKGNEQREVQKAEEEQRTGRVPGLEGRTDDTTDRSGEGTTKTDDSGVRGTTTERSRESSDERIAGEIVGNFRITDEITLHEGGKKTRYKNNVAAIKLVKQLDIEGRKATLEEQKVLAKYVGWGGITEAFYDDEPKWANEYKELKELLTEEEYRFARESRLNAHYTAREIIDKMYQAVKRLGFKNGKILEPAVGSGNFFGLLPEEFFNSQLHAVELEPITGKIASYLYPEARVNIMGYENYKVPNNYFDLIISNVPFGNFRVNDKDYNHLKFSIHNYYFAKSLDKVKEGGIVAFVTSSFTMDSKDKSVREYVNSKAELLGAIRLPNNAFSENAGTEVTTDIIFLRKLKQGEVSHNKWLSMGEIDGVPVNEYYVDNPNMLLGTMVFSKNMYGSEESTTLVSKVDDISEIFDNAINNLPENVFDVSTNFVEVEKVTTIGDYKLGKYEKVGSIVLIDNKAYQVLDDRLEPMIQNKTVEKNGVKTKVEVPLEGKRIDRIKGMIGVKEALRKAVDAQLNDLSDEAINEAIKNLNDVYDGFVKANGYINDNANKLAFRDDADYQRIASLEKWDAKNKKYSKSDVFYKRTIIIAQRATKADNAIDGLGIVLNEDGFVDVDRIATLIDKTINEVISDLKGLIYKNPKTKTYQTKDEYLSGNVKEKLRIAKAYAKDDPGYNENVEALEKVIPEDVPAKDIDTKLGQPWIDDTIIEDFTNTLLENDGKGIKVRYISVSGDWVVEGTTVNRAVSTNKFGTPRMSAEEIIENLLNSKEVRVNVYVGTGDDRAIDKKASKIETAKALEKAKLIVKEFRDYIFADQERRNYLVGKYNELFNNTVLRKYDGSFLTFNGMSDDIRVKFRGYQKSAVARIIFSGNTLLAHTVGAGKTFEMIAGALELKRLGLANKPMFVVPNHLIEQWENAFYQLYPNANILAATKDDFTKENRKRLFSMISNNNYDAVIVAHSSFGKIPVSKETEIEFVNEEIQDVEQAIIAAKEAEGESSRVTKQLEKTLKNLRTRLEELNDISQDNVVTFEELGVDYLFVDEAHNFKNLFFYTKMSRIAGVQNSKAKRATNMYMKTRLISRLHNNKRGIVFATGTPVSNSIAEMFTMQRYLQLETLKEMGAAHFDAWANMFGDTVTKPEVDKTGKGFKMKTRFTDYVNVPELKKLFRSFADIINQDDLKRFLQEEGLGVNALPEMDGGKPITVQAEPSEQLVAYIEELVARSEAVEKGKVEPTEDNALKITNDGRVSALDMRLIDSSYPDDPNSKLNLAIANVFQEYQDGNKDKTAQLIFSDLGTPKKQKTKEQKLKERKVVRANGYETYQWYYDKENQKKYVVVKIDKENEEVYKLFEDGDEAVDAMADSNTDNKTYAPYGFSIDIDDYIDSLGGDETEFEVKFDIYNDIREKLVSMGVPRNEIAFIHEANTDLAKEKLFDKVRKGDVRILLGSTAKMGEGMNVQDRLIALHHLDAPWKPSAIEQRNGRIIRFGNMHSKVRVYQYVTKGSFDAYIWSMLERKATFISKIMDSDFSTRKYKDAFDPVVLNASEVKALASSDPRILEKFEVDKQVEELENLKQSHRAEQYEIQDKISRNQKTIDKSDTLLTNLKTDIKSVVNLKGDNFKVVIGGKTYDTRKEAGPALMDELEKLDNFVEEEVGSFGGFKLFLYRTGAENKGILRGKGKYEIQLSTSPSGNITRLENLLNEPERRLNEVIRITEAAKKEIVTYKEQLGKPFAREEELEQVLKRQAELDNELSLDKPEEGPESTNTIEENDPTPKSGGTRASIPNASTSELPNGERKRPKKVKPISEIIKDISNDFDTSVSSKRYRDRRGATGQYQTHSESIRVKTDNNIQTIAHELGHHFDKKYNLSTRFSSYIKAMEEGLSLSGQYKAEEIPGEVIAEFIRLHLVTENKAYELNPDFYNGFMETLDKKDLKNLNKHREDILNWYASDLMARGQSTIRSHTEKKKTSIDNKLTNLEMSVFDDLAPLRLFSETVEEYTGQKLQFSQHPYVLAMQSRRAGMMAKAQIIYGQTDAEGNVIGESFKELLKDIPKDQMKAFDDYLKVSHAITLHEYGKQVYSDDFTIEDMELMKTTYELDNPQFAEAAQGVYKWWNKFVEEWVVKQGFLDPGIWADLQERYPTYVPNFRYTDEENYSTRARKGFGNQKSPIKRMKGSAKDTYSVIESLLLYTDKIVRTQKRNEVGLAVHNLYQSTEGLGDVLTKISHETQLNKYNAMDLKVSLTTQLITDYIDKLTSADKDKANKLADDGEYEELMKFLTEKGFAGAEIIDNTIDDVITFFTPRMFSTDNSVYTIIDKAGKTHFYEVHDPLFLEAMLNLSDKSMDKVTRLIGAWKRMFTNLTTGANPIFGLTSNIWGDVPQAFIYGSYKNPLAFGVDLGKSMKDIFTGNEKAEAYYAMGGGMSSPISENRQLMTEMLNKLFPDMKKSGIKNMVDYVIGQIEQFNDTIESAPRLTEFTKVMEEYGDTYEGRLRAIYEASELTTNFLRHGRMQYTIIGQGVPFLNAGLQGMYKLHQEYIRRRGAGRNDLTGDGDKKKDNKRLAGIMLKALLGITIFEILQMMAYQDDEEYNNLAEYLKDGYWLIKYDDGKFVRIKKPRAEGMIFGTMFRRGFRQGIGDKKAWEEFSDSFVNTFLPPNPLTDNIFAGVIGVGRNKTWAGNPIVPVRLQNLPPLEQYDISTSSIAKAVSQVLNKTTGIETSPKNIDYLIQQYTGIIGQVLLPATTETTTLADSLKRKMTTDLAFSNKVVNEFYEKKEILDAAYTLYNQKGTKSKDFDPVLRYRYNQANKEMSDIWGQINDLKENPTLSQAEKKDQERTLRLQLLELARPENLKPTSYDEFKVLYNRGQDMTSEFKEQFEATKTRPQYTKEEQILLELYNVKVDGQRSQLGAVNYQLNQINKRRKQLEGTNTLTEANKKKALQKLDESEKQITNKYMEFYKTRYNIDISKYF